MICFQKQKESFIKELVKSVSKISFSTFTSIVSGMVRTKFLAMLTGTTGVGVYSSIFNLYSLVTAILPIGSLGLNKFISQYFDEDKKEKIFYLLRYFVFVNVPIAIAVTSLIILFSSNISNMLFNNENYELHIKLFSLSIPLFVVNNIIDTYLKGTRKINLYVLFVSLNSIILLAAFVPLVIFWSLHGAIIAFGAGIVFNFFNGIIILKKYQLFPDFKKIEKIDPAILKSIYKIGVASIIMLIFQNLSLLALRSIITDKFGLQNLGIFQSVYSISTNYIGLFFGILGTYTIPKMSTLKNNDDIVLETNNLIRFLLIFFTPLILVFIAFKGIIINLLYSKEFISAESILDYQLLGDFFKIISWSLGIWLVPCLKIKQWVIFDVLYSLSYMGIFLIINTFWDIGIKAVCISYLIININHLVINLLFIRKSLNFKFQKVNLTLLCFSLIFIVALIVSSIGGIELKYIVFSLTFLIWIYINIKNLNLEQIKSFFKK
ncbi:MAG: oligosaccharide flippase family protein [Bacteroidetes bacterium]|nr:oligosaccharide flippase family protein [Bacteroidota bacterium]